MKFAVEWNLPVEAMQQHDWISVLLLLERPHAAARYRAPRETGLNEDEDGISSVLREAQPLRIEHTTQHTKIGRNWLAWTGTRSIRLARRMAAPSQMRSTAWGRKDGNPAALVPLAVAPAPSWAEAAVEAATLRRDLGDAASGGSGSAGREEEVRSSGIWSSLAARLPALVEAWSCVLCALRCTGVIGREDGGSRVASCGATLPRARHK